MQCIISSKLSSPAAQNGVLFGFRRHLPSGEPAFWRSGCEVDVFLHRDMLVSVRETTSRLLLLTGWYGPSGVTWHHEATWRVPGTAMEMVAQDLSDLLFAYQRSEWFRLEAPPPPARI